MAREELVEWHGWRVADGVQLHIGRVPRRTKLALYIAETNDYMARITPLAYFNSESDAASVRDILDGWVDRMNMLEKRP